MRGKLGFQRDGHGLPDVRADADLIAEPLPAQDGLLAELGTVKKRVGGAKFLKRRDLNELNVHGLPPPAHAAVKCLNTDYIMRPDGASGNSENVLSFQNIEP